MVVTWLADTFLAVRKQLHLLPQRCYALGWTPARPEGNSETDMTATVDVWKCPPALAPIKSLHALLHWDSAEQPFHNLFRCTVPLLQSKQVRRGNEPSLLVCHDLDGNYHSDALPQGDGNSDYYRLTDWANIDVFVYFSHALVTIPPVGWINAAHRNNTPVLGTFITEWADGSLLCELLLWTQQACEEAAMQLAHIAAYYGFDGWLLNIENPVLRRLIPNLIHFIRVLKKVMHELVPGSQVIWYDAVTTAGILEWQDTLNDHNMPFFEAADAIFVNYTWKEDTPQLAAAVAGARKSQVYMGVDVFGRNTFGGGGMTCDVALKVARSAGLSAALFAPAWVWQVGDKADWLRRQQDFWGKVRACWEEPLPSICNLPFSTCFDQGAGLARYTEGAVLSDAPWYNLSSQSPMPNPRQPPEGFYNPFIAFTHATTSSVGSASATPVKIAAATANLAAPDLPKHQLKHAADRAEQDPGQHTADRPGTQSTQPTAETAEEDPAQHAAQIPDQHSAQPATHKAQEKNTLYAADKPQEASARQTAGAGTSDNSGSLSTAADSQIAQSGDQGSGAKGPAQHLEARLCMDLAFRLGSCLEIKGSVAPHTSASVEIFTADLLIPQPGIQASFTYKLTDHQQVSLELWCWFEPSSAPEPHTASTPPSRNVNQHNIDSSSQRTLAASVHHADGTAQSSRRAGGLSVDMLRQKQDLGSSRQSGGSSHLSVSSSDARAAEVGKQRVLVMLQPEGYVIIDPCQEPHGAMFSQHPAEMIQHDTGWVTQIYHLPASLPDFQHLTLRSLEVAAVGLAHSGQPSTAGCLGYVGHIGLTAIASPVQEPVVSEVKLADVRWAASKTAALDEAQISHEGLPGSSQSVMDGENVMGLGHNETSFDLYLYTTLCICLAAGSEASRYEVYHKFVTSSDSAALAHPDTAAASPNGCMWTGTAFASEYRICQLLIPETASSVSFLVQPADVLGKLVPVANATHVTLLRP